MTPQRIVNPHYLKPYEFQHRAYRFVLYHGSCYLMLDMGMGKTRICIEVGRTLDIPMFILAPRYAAIETWPDEFRKWYPGADFAVLHGPNKEQIWANTTMNTNIILNYDGLKWFNKVVNKGLRPLQKYMFVFDEASMLKNHESNRWLICNNMMPIMSPYRVHLSGTPVPQSLKDLWAQYYLLDKGKALCPDFYQFRNRFFDFDHETYMTTIKPWAPKKIHELIKPITMRLAAEDYLDLPDLIHNPIRISLPAGMRRLYDELEQEFMLEFPTSTVIANSEAVLSHKLRQFLQGAVYSKVLSGEGSHQRLRTTVEHLHELKAQVVRQLLDTANGKPMLIAVQFKYEIGILEKVLQKKVPAITGKTSGPEGQRLIREWNKGALPFLVVHPKSVAYSLNLQFGGSDIVYMALPWELDLYLQLIKRLHRQGQLSKSVVVTTIAFKNTVDDKVAYYLTRKERTQEGLFRAVQGRAA